MDISPQTRLAYISRNASGTPLRARGYEIWRHCFFFVFVFFAVCIMWNDNIQDKVGINVDISPFLSGVFFLVP